MCSIYPTIPIIDYIAYIDLSISSRLASSPQTSPGLLSMGAGMLLKKLEEAPVTPPGGKTRCETMTTTCKFHVKPS